jgi:membrane protease YdiL (CAAX protease family)
MVSNAELLVPSRNLATRIAAAWLLGGISLAFAGWFGGELVEAYGIGSRLRFGIQAAVMSGLVVPGVWLLRHRLDRRSFAGLEMLGLARSLTGFALGIGLILVPSGITLLCTMVFGWATLSINPAPGAATAIAIGILTAFFFEALPEELIFRGYIFRNLNTTLRKWTAGLVTTILFTLLPVFVVLVQRYLLKTPIVVGPSDHITTGYLLTMFFFATFLQYLRVLTGTVWAGIGFHLFFLMSNRIIGTREASFIRMSDLTTEGPMQIVMLGSIALVFGVLLLYPRLSGRSLEWGKVNPE